MFPFLTTTDPDDTISIYPVRIDEFKDWYEKRSETTKSQVNVARFTAKPGETIIIRNNKGELKRVYYGVSNPISTYDIASLPDFLLSRLSDDTLQSVVFELKDMRSKADLEKLVLGWGLGCYFFDKYKTKAKKGPRPILKLPKGFEENDVVHVLAGVYTCRDLVNEPPNKLGPAELVEEATKLAKTFKAKIHVIHDKDLLKENYPMIYTVGDGSERRPALIDIRWGNPKHPKVTLVGKGVCYDTGGLNLKPGDYMRTMKKDMGGAAHVLGLAHSIMLAKLPINMRVLVPAVENAISGRSFRPDDVYPTRKGITVEIDNTDAEGRLVLSDSLYEGCSEKPEIIIDFATLTGAARVATGAEIPPFFSNNHDVEEKIKKISFKIDDPVWPMPLWDGYRNQLSSDVADICHVSPSKLAGHITAALFLQEFIDKDIPWLHFDVAAWSYKSRPGRPLGGTDMGLRTIFAYLKETYK